MKQDFSSESEIYDFWIKEKLFSADPKSSRRDYSLLIPPPNLTGELHLGHAMQHSILDAIARYKRLCGFDVLLLPGIDHAGIAFETTFEKELKKQNLSREKLGREEWLRRAWEFKEQIYKSVSKSWRFMGLSADWEREVFTLDKGPRRAVFEQFKAYFDAGLIYKGPYIVEWCPKCNTAIEDVEMDYEERKEKLYYIKYQIVRKANFSIEKANIKYPKSIIAATTRPETIFADAAVAIYPNHPKYKKFVGFEVSNPLTGMPIPVIEDRRVEKDFGTGALKITPGHDFLDYEIGKDNNLEIKQVVDKDGRLTSLGGDFQGLTVSSAREKVVVKLKADGLIEKEEEYAHNVAVCERCKSVVEPIISDEWFVKVGDLAKDAIKVIKAGKINFLPKNYAKILIAWLENIHDWCISRSLWWGHRIPVWYPPAKLGTEPDDMKVSFESPGSGWVQDEQVLDTWFSSGLWPLSTLNWYSSTGPVKKISNFKFQISNLDESRARGTRDDSLFDRYFPWDFEISAPEIKYLWIARMIMISVYFTEKVPFKTMFFHGMLRDLAGRKFSKSLGNGIEPTYLIDKWGVDATRMTLYTYSVPGRDGRVSREILDERGKNFRNFGTKLRNIARFIIELKPADSNRHSGLSRIDSGVAPQSGPPQNDMAISSRPFDQTQAKQVRTIKMDNDKWIKDELQKTIKKVTNHIENLELHLAVDEIYEFIWHQFADQYIEAAKARREEAQAVLEYVLKTCLILLHPFMPFLTEEIYQKFGEKRSIMLESWPIENKSS